MCLEDIIMAKAYRKTMMHKGGSFGGFYCLGFIGAAVHFVGNVDGFGNIIAAVLKALVWPAFLINKIFDVLNV